MITTKDAEIFDQTYPLLVSLHQSFKLLSAKKPADSLNVFKCKQVNKILKVCNALLENLRPDQDFQAFDVDLMPTNSDCFLMLDLYVASMDMYKQRNSRTVGGDDWAISNPHTEWITNK